MTYTVSSGTLNRTQPANCALYKSAHYNREIMAIETKFNGVIN